MRIPAIASLLAGFGLLCLSNPAVCQSPSAASAATSLYLNGRIYTNDPAMPWAESIAIRDEKILAVGTEKEVRAVAEKGSTVVDLGGRFVTPGFNDAHVHLSLAGQDLAGVQLAGVPSIAEMQRRVKDAIAQHQDGDWITGIGWHQEKWPDKKFPTRKQMDVVSPKNPVFLYHLSGHIAIANSFALKIAGITRETRDLPGGQIERDESGEPTGIMKEEAAMNLVAAHIPKPTMEQRRHGIELTIADAARSGVTSVQDNSDWEDFLVFRQLQKEGKLTVRITEWLWYDFPLETLQARVVTAELPTPG